MTDLISREDALAALDQHAHGATTLGGQTYRSITLEVAVEAIRALPAVAASQQVRVKPLVWEDLGGHYENRFAKADAPLFGSIRCESYLKRQFTVSWSVPGFSSLFMECVFPTLESAKAAAQADYEARILAAIETQPDPRDAVIAQLVEAVEACITSMEHADMSDGVCCCGDNMDGHSDPMSCGHAPVDMGDYHASKAIATALAAISAAKGGAA